ncbi:hypothetical protein [Marilutibacter chinensis]|uniref:Phasin domain-containing protein n=1 Tax=Marilutibacter chinensis TaxID=2912247 RepID=A0ABS9HVT3_9GAMM|nr:hypothetical protein [Lysobacter chinensis]MCF7222275.1 hypothetical protein [Lysobacter chinensis]
MAFWFKRRKKPTAAPVPGSAAAADPATTDGSATASASANVSDDATAGANSNASDGAATGGSGAPSSPAGGGGGDAPPAPPPPRSSFGRMTDRLMTQSTAAPPDVPALNPQIVQAVQMSNAETTAYAPSQIAIGPNMMISQAAGLVAQSAASYFDGVSKLALASQGVLLKDMTESLVSQQLEKAAEDAIGVLATDVMMGAAAAVAAAAGAMEAEAASFAIDRIDQSIAKYADLLANRRDKS